MTEEEKEKKKKDKTYFYGCGLGLNGYTSIYDILHENKSPDLLIEMFRLSTM